MSRQRRDGFTLVEVAIATLILVVSCLVLLMLLPGSLRAQQQSRYRMLAAVHAQNVIEGFIHHETDLRTDVRDGRWDQRVRFDFGNFTKPDDRGLPVFNADSLHGKLAERRMLGPLGTYDLERQVTTRAAGNYPVPLPIAARLDSPGDEIREILDGGGYVYYSDPVVGGRLDDQVRGRHLDVEERSGMQRLIWGVVGYAQQNLLPFDPAAVPTNELYPFPPIARSGPTDRRYRGSIQFSYEREGGRRVLPAGSVWDGAVLRETVTGLTTYRRVNVGDTFFTEDVCTSDDMRLHKDQDSYPQNNAWVWYAETDPDPASPWRQGIDAYHRLVNQHWLRILHQLDQIHIGQQANTSPLTSNRKAVPADKQVTVVKSGPDGNVLRGDGGRPVTETRTVPTEVTFTLDNEGNPVAAVGGLDTGDVYRSNRGYPAPAKGLGIGHLRGSDILEEDAAAVRQDLANQLRISLPSLERRIMYRTAALALWARVYRGVDIIGSGDPNVANDLGRLAAEDNPLDPAFRLPPVDQIHPAQVLALSHLAHAAVMVTGYKMPFYHNHNTLEAHDDELLVPDGNHPEFNAPYEQLPYRAVENSSMLDVDGNRVTTEVDVALADGSLATIPVDASTGVVDLSAIAGQIHERFLTGGVAGGEILDADGNPNNRIVAVDPERWVHLHNPYHPDVMLPTTEPLVSTGPVASSDRRIYQLGPGNRPLMYRRMTGGMLNPFPPPYADRGSFDMAGQRTYTVRWQLAVAWDDDETRTIPTYRLLRKVVASSGPVDADSAMAARAHEASLSLAMAFVSENPYDLTVPKPANRQTFIDRGLYQWDLFDGGGQARRIAGLTPLERYRSFYPITFPVGPERADAARFLPQFVYAESIDSPRDFMEWHKMATSFPPQTTGEPFELGRPHTGLPGDACSDPFAYQKRYATWVNGLHGFSAGDLNGNQTQARRPERCHATKRFEAADRTRQLVYWLVDWQKYEDAESAPSAPVDRSQLSGDAARPFTYGSIARYTTGELAIDFGKDRHGYVVGDTARLHYDALGSFDLVIASFDSDRWVFSESPPGSLAAFTDHLGERAALQIDQGTAGSANDARFLRGNPEQNFCWIDPERTATRHVWERGSASVIDDDSGSGSAFQGYYASDHIALPLSRFYYGQTGREAIISDDDIERNALWALGAWGADRNGNGTFDIGPVPRGSRMQAVEISRFNFYDPVCWISLRR